MDTKPKQYSTKRNKNPAIPGKVIALGKFLQLLHPYFVTLYALNLFKTPWKYPTPIREKMMDKSAQKERLTIPAINKEIMVYTYGYSKRKVLLVHGWSGRGTQLYAIADKLLENGFMTISFDAPAHGKSTGKQTVMPEFVEAIKVLNEKFGPFEIAIGHSLGGMAIINNISQGLKIRKAITIGSWDKISDIIENFVKFIQLKPAIAVRIEKILIKKFDLNIDQFSASIAGKKVDSETLVIHDEGDKVVPVSSAHSIRQSLKYGDLLITQGLGHSYILNNKEVIQEIINFIKKDS
jgi:pimeloyl-ACP methyl ester carboxylesterase